MLTAVQHDNYHVRLPVFEGPLDLLLQLIESEKLDISSVSLALVTDQFLAHVREMAAVEADVLADFLLMAARLIWIKSYVLLPQPAKPADQEEEDPGEALARQLREYKRFKQAAEALRAIEARGLHTYPREAPPPELDRRLDSHDITLEDLLAAAHRALAAQPPPPVPPGVVVPFTLTIKDQIRLIRLATQSGQDVTFRSLLLGARHRLEIIVTLLAVLELIKRRQINASQDTLFGEIVLKPVPGVEITDESPPENGSQLTSS